MFSPDPNLNRLRSCCLFDGLGAGVIGSGSALRVETFQNSDLSRKD